MCFLSRCRPCASAAKISPLLSWTFVKEFSNSMGKAIDAVDADSMAALLAYSWPSNIRELRNVIERAMILARGPTLHIKLGHPSLRPQIANGITGTLDEFEREHILHALDSCGWRIRGLNAAARLLGVKPTTLESRIKKLGLVQKH
jgi:DNA-binding NtrC family response regulator